MPLTLGDMLAAPLHTFWLAHCPDTNVLLTNSFTHGVLTNMAHLMLFGESCCHALSLLCEVGAAMYCKEPLSAALVHVEVLISTVLQCAALVLHHGALSCACA
jgi:hypothetical protein